jgi:hypothetical protein
MNANGIQIFTRAYNAPSTSGNPSAIAIQIGKGLKGVTKDLYQAAGKVNAGSLDYFLSDTSTVARGMATKEYNEQTGILVLDAGFHAPGGVTISTLIFSDTTSQTSGYLVINASKNPALTGIGLNRIAARATNTSGQTFTNGVEATVTGWTKDFDTNGAFNTNGTYIVPESGYYQVNYKMAIANGTITANTGVVYGAVTQTGSITRRSNQVTVIGPQSGQPYGSSLSDVFFCARGDVLTFGFSQSNGANRAIYSTGNDLCTLSIAKVSV